MNRKLPCIVSFIMWLHVTIITFLLIQSYVSEDIPFMEYVVTLPFIVGWSALPLYLMRFVARKLHTELKERLLGVTTILVLLSSLVVYCKALYGESDAQMALVFFFVPVYQLLVSSILMGIITIYDHLHSTAP
jgi:hypothetical protein